MAGGGAERQLTYLAAGLCAADIEVHVALAARGPNWSRLVASGARIHELSARGPHDPLLFVRLFTTIQSVDPDLVQVWLRQMDVLGGLAATALRKPLILTERASRAAYPPSVKHMLRRGVGRLADAIVSNSEQGERYWRGAGSRPRRCVIRNAVPVDEIAAAPGADRIAAADDRRLVLFAGRMEPQKNLETLLPALLLALGEEEFDVWFCGEGTQQSLVREWIAANRLEPRAQLIGYTPELWSLMKRASALVSPAWFEGIPNVVLEAMACRCPLVVSDIPEHREILDEHTAVMVDPSSPVELAAALRRVLSDPDAARARADAAFARVERFRPAAMAGRYLDLYRSVLANSSASRQAGA